MKFRCSSCHGILEQPYHQIGIPSKCDSCGEIVDLNESLIISKSDTGTEITYSKFSNLLWNLTAADIKLLILEPVEKYSAFPPLVAFQSEEYGWEFSTHNQSQ